MQMSRWVRVRPWGAPVWEVLTLRVLQCQSGHLGEDALDCGPGSPSPGFHWRGDLDAMPCTTELDGLS